MQKSGVKMTNIVSEDILTTTQSYVSADNVEVAPNYKHDHGLIKNVYADFFNEYLTLYAKEDGLNSEKVPVGIGYSDALTDLPKAPNTFAPEAPVGYSDKLHPNVYVLPLKSEYPDSAKTIIKHEKPQTKEIPPKVRGVAPLTSSDTLAISYLEGKAYADNESLMVNLHNMENALIGKDINNARKNRANMSFKYTDDKGKVCGYLLAYEGTLAETKQEGESENILYIADLASDKQNTRAGGSLIKAFVEQYQKEFLEKGKMTPIYMEAREQTSYKIVQKQLERLAADMNMDVEMEELPTYRQGADTMHPVILRPKARP
jgi:hypothetical protein